MNTAIHSVAKAISRDGLSFSGDRNGLRVLLGLLYTEVGGAPEDVQREWMKASLKVLARRHEWATDALVRQDGSIEDEWDRQHREDQVFSMMVEVFFWQKILDGEI